MPGHRGHGSMPLSPTDRAITARDRGTAAFRRQADLRISKDRRNWPRQASHGTRSRRRKGLVTTIRENRRPSTSSALEFLTVPTRARLHNSRLRRHGAPARDDSGQARRVLGYGPLLGGIAGYWTTDHT